MSHGHGSRSKRGSAGSAGGYDPRAVPLSRHRYLWAFLRGLGTAFFIMYVLGLLVKLVIYLF